MADVSPLSDLRQGLLGAFRLLVSGDPEVYAVVRQSLVISLSASLLALALGLPLGSLLAFSRFRGRALLIGLSHAGFGLPPVLVGLVLALLTLRHGPLGALDLRFSPFGVVLAQFLISLPIVVGLSAAALEQLPPRLGVVCLSFGGSRLRTTLLLWREARLPLVAAYAAAFGAVVSEVGASLMMGGNLRGSTRVLTTAIVMETSMGHYDRALALGIILLGLVSLVAVGIALLARRRLGEAR